MPQTMCTITILFPYNKTLEKEMPTTPVNMRRNSMDEEPGRHCPKSNMTKHYSLLHNKNTISDTKA